MPLYEYRCESCGDRFEVMQKFSDDPLRVHEGCGGPVARLLSPPALQFKGSGWYITDYARKGNGNHSAEPAKKDDKPATKDAGKTETPPAKTESK